MRVSNSSARQQGRIPRWNSRRCRFGRPARLYFSSNRGPLGDAVLGNYIVTTSDLSRVLFRDLLLPFEVTSVLILVAILGAVALARREH